MDARKSICLFAVLALLAVPAAGGLGSGGEPTLASALAHSPVLSGLVHGLKKEDDETDAREGIENAPYTQEEREEAREQREQVALESAPEPQGEGG